MVRGSIKGSTLIFGLASPSLLYGFPLNNIRELSEAFSLFICLDANKFVVLTFFSLIMMIYLKFSTRRERERSALLHDRKMAL